MQPPNVILLVIDTVRADRVSSYGYERETTPNFDAFASHATVYTDAVSQAAWSIPSHASLLTGRYPSEHGATSVGPIFQYSPTLPELLQEAGYETYAISPNEYVRPSTGFGRGFDEFYTCAGMPVPPTLAALYAPVVNWGTRTPSIRLPIEQWLNDRRAGHPWHTGNDHTYEDDVVAHITDVVERAKAPYFLLANVIDAHLPRSPRQTHYDRFVDPALEDVQVVPNERAHTFGRRMSERAIEKMAQLYDANLRTMDEKLGEVLAVLADSGALDESLVVIVSDHGENLGEFGFIGHQFSLFDSVVSVPLAISHPEDGPRAIQQQVETRRVFHTILDEAGVHSYPDQSLRSDQPDELARGEFLSPMLDVGALLETGTVRYDPGLAGKRLAFRRTGSRKELRFDGRRWEFPVPEWEERIAH